MLKQKYAWRFGVFSTPSGILCSAQWRNMILKTKKTILNNKNFNLKKILS